MQEGRVFRFGNNIDTDTLAPGGVLHLGLDEIKRHCLEAVDPEFSSSVEEGDVIVAGRNFGVGSSREQAPLVLKSLGVKLVLAESFARIFFRNAVNVGLMLGTAEPAQLAHIKGGERIKYSIDESLFVLPSGMEIGYSGPSGPLSEILREGGMRQYVRKRTGQK